MRCCLILRQVNSMSINWTALITLGVLTVLYLGFLTRRRTLKPYMAYSKISFLNDFEYSWRVHFNKMPLYLYALSVFLLALAFINPVFQITRLNEELPNKSKPLPPASGAAIYLLLDQSGSMAEKVVRETSTSVNYPTKIEELKKVTRLFIKGDPGLGLSGRPNDMIGIIGFARAAQVVSPLTLDHKALLKLLDNIDVVKDKTQDVTAIGYAIYKTANMIAATRHFAEKLPADKQAAFKIENAIMILVTDGFQSPNPTDKGKRLRNIGVEEAAAFAKKQGVRLYVIGIDPLINEEEVAPQRRQMERVAEITGGRYYPLSEISKLSVIYQEIDRLEKNQIPVELIAKKNPKKFISADFAIYPYLIGIALAVFLSAILLETTVLRRAP